MMIRHNSHCSQLQIKTCRTALIAERGDNTTCTQLQGLYMRIDYTLLISRRKEETKINTRSVYTLKPSIQDVLLWSWKHRKPIDVTILMAEKKVKWSDKTRRRQTNSANRTCQRCRWRGLLGAQVPHPRSHQEWRNSRFLAAAAPPLSFRQLCVPPFWKFWLRWKMKTASSSACWASVHNFRAT